MHDAGSSGLVILESGIALAVFVGILLALADTPLYPIAFGAVALAGLYVLLEHPTFIPGLVKWSSGKLQ